MRRLLVVQALSVRGRSHARRRRRASPRRALRVRGRSRVQSVVVMLCGGVIGRVDEEVVFPLFAERVDDGADTFG